MTPLTCPKCGKPLVSVSYREIEVDRCRQCGGIWFDAQEAEKLREIKGSETLDDSEVNLHPESLNSQQQKLFCPRCRRSMIRMLDIDQHSIWYEKCPKCQGIWFDAGEFKQFKRNFRSKTVVDWVKNVLSFEK